MRVKLNRETENFSRCACNLCLMKTSIKAMQYVRRRDDFALKSHAVVTKNLRDVT